jgi:hypothetical protein
VRWAGAGAQALRLADALTGGRSFPFAPRPYGAFRQMCGIALAIAESQTKAGIGLLTLGPQDVATSQCAHRCWERGVRRVGKDPDCGPESPSPAGHQCSPLSVIEGKSLAQRSFPRARASAHVRPRGGSLAATRTAPWGRVRQGCRLGEHRRGEQRWTPRFLAADTECDMAAKAVKKSAGISSLIDAGFPGAQPC